MNIAAERHGDIGVSEDGPEALHVKAHFYSSCGESVAQGVEIGVRNPGFLEHTLEFPLQGTWLHNLLVPGEQKAFTFPQGRKKHAQAVRQRDDPR